MKCLILITMVAVLFATAATAQAARVDLYTDANRSGCEVSDQGAALHIIYLVLAGNTSSTGVRFSAPKPDCWLGSTWAGDTIVQGGQIGNSQSDWSVGFGECKTLPFLFARVSYFATGGGLSCCQMLAKNSTPSPGTFVWTDCGFGEYPLQPDGQKVVINPNSSCRCQNPLATEPTTWGRVKSLYR
jgi:hypothetical protein